MSGLKPCVGRCWYCDCTGSDDLMLINYATGRITCHECAADLRTG